MLDPQGPLPLYEQLKVLLRKAIESGTWAPHAAIPPERELIERYGVSRITVRQAITDLVAEGWLYRRQGSGTFVASRQPGPIAVTLTRLTGHVEELQMRGLNPTVDVLALDRTAMPAPVAEALARAEGSLAWHLRRLVRVEGRPLLILDGYLPLDLELALDQDRLRQIPVPRLLEEAGLAPVQGALQIGARSATAEEAAALDLSPGAALLQVTRVIKGPGGRPLEWTRAVYPADRYHYEVELRRR